MPYKEKETVKLYYSMNDVAIMFDVNQSLIRYWENEFEELQPRKNKKGNRMFTPKDIECLKIIFNLLKVQGLTIEGAKRYLKGNQTVVQHEIKSEKNQNSELKDKLKKIKKALVELGEKL